MLKKVSLVVVISVFILTAAGLFLPSRVHVERSIGIMRPAVTVFTVLNGYRSFMAWSPWADHDPDLTYEFSGPEAGVGARMNWSGDPRLVGSGWQEITESQPNRLLRMHLNFDYQGAADSYFQLNQQPGGVRVTWGFDADLLEGQGWFSGVLARYFGLFFDQWIGTDYELGLARLKTYLEAMPPADFSDLDVKVVQAEPQDILYVSTAGPDALDLSSSLASAYQEITAFMTENSIEMSAQPMAITRIREQQGYDFEAAIPVVFKDVPPTGRIHFGRSPAGRALRVIHRGPYDRMAPSYEKLAAWAAAHGLAEGRVSWEQYISDPGETRPDELITHIYFLIEDGR